MIKKILFVILLSCLLNACGKKGDPIYKDPDQKAELTIIITNKA